MNLIGWFGYGLWACAGNDKIAKASTSATRRTFIGISSGCVVVGGELSRPQRKSRRSFIQTTSFSQRSAVPGFCFSDARLRPSPCFPSPSNKEGHGAPGGAQEVCETSSAGFARPGQHAKLPGPKGWREVGVPGRAGPCEEPGRLSALHRGTHCRRPHLAHSSGAAIDGALERARHTGCRSEHGCRKV